MSRSREGNNRKEVGLRVLIFGFPLILGLLSLDSGSWPSSFPPDLVLSYFSLLGILFIQRGLSPRSQFFVCLRSSILESQVFKLRLFILGLILSLLSQFSGLPQLPSWVFSFLYNSRLEPSTQLSQVFKSLSNKAYLLYIVTLRASDSLRPEVSIHLGTQVFHFSLQVSSLNPSVFYFGPSTFCPCQVFYHLRGQPGVRNSSAMLILIGDSLHLLGRG